MKKLIFALIFGSFSCFAATQAQTPVKLETVKCACPNGLAELVETLLPTVVNISTTQKAFQRNSANHAPFFPNRGPFEEFNDMLEQFGLTPPQTEMDDENFDEQVIDKPLSLGSGFIIDPKGLIVTNYHVIKDADKITVRLSDDKELKAEVIGKDIKTDLALLKVKSKHDLPFVKFGDSDKSRVGEGIVAIGNPFGLGGTVTSGIISAKSRDVDTTGSIVDNFIQTDAAINSGNSGGPMFNLKGEVIGINTAIFSPSGGNVGIGFAVPSSVVRNVTQQLKENGSVLRGWLGVTIQNVTPEIAENLTLEKGKGALVSDLSEGSPAAKSGIQVGDVITKFNGSEISTTKRLSRIVSETKVGEKVPVEIIRKGKKSTIFVLIEKANDTVVQVSKGLQKNSENFENKYGIAVEVLTDKIKVAQNIPTKISGLIVTKINKRGFWGKHGILPGHVIIAADQNKLSSLNDLNVILEKVKKSGRKNVLLHIFQNGNSIFVPFPVK